MNFIRIYSFFCFSLTFAFEKNHFQNDPSPLVITVYFVTSKSWQCEKIWRHHLLVRWTTCLSLTFPIHFIVSKWFSSQCLFPKLCLYSKSAHEETQKFCTTEQSCTILYAVLWIFPSLPYRLWKTATLYSRAMQWIQKQILNSKLTHYIWYLNLITLQK